MLEYYHSNVLTAAYNIYSLSAASEGSTALKSAQPLQGGARVALDQGAKLVLCEPCKAHEKQLSNSLSNFSVLISS